MTALEVSGTFSCIRGRAVIHGICTATAGARESTSSCNVHAHVQERAALPQGG